MLETTLTGEQKELLEVCFNADAKIQGMIHLDRLRYAFHLGARLITELIEEKEEIFINKLF